MLLKQDNMVTSKADTHTFHRRQYNFPAMFVFSVSNLTQTLYKLILSLLSPINVNCEHYAFCFDARLQLTKITSSRCIQRVLKRSYLEVS